MNPEPKIDHIQIHQNLEIFKDDLESALMTKPKTMIITVFVILYRLQDNQDQNRHQMALVSGLKLITWRFVSPPSLSYYYPQLSPSKFYTQYFYPQVLSPIIYPRIFTLNIFTLKFLPSDFYY